MLSSGQETPSTSNFQLIFNNALADYTRLTGNDLSKVSFTSPFKHSNSPEAILDLLQRKKNTFEEYQDGNQRLISCLGPTVRILHACSRVLGEAASLVSDTCYLVSPLM